MTLATGSPSDLSRRSFLAGAGAALLLLRRPRPQLVTAYLLDENGDVLTDEAGDRLTSP